MNFQQAFFDEFEKTALSLVGARRAARLLKVGGFRLPKIPKPKGGPLNPFAKTFRLGARLAGSVTGTNVR